MKYIARKKVYLASNVKYFPDTKKAYSYGHWCFVKPFGDYLIFNSYPYSITTQRHQRKVRELLRTLGLEYVEVQTPDSLNQLSATSHRWLENKIIDLRVLINKPRTSKNLNIERERMVQDLEFELRTLQYCIDETLAGRA